MRSLLFFILTGAALLALSGCGESSLVPESPLAQFDGDWRGTFEADSVLLSISSAQGSVTGTAIFWRDSFELVGAINGVVNRNTIEFDISFADFAIDGTGQASGDSFTGEFREWMTTEDEYRMPHTVLIDGGIFLLERKSIR